MPLLPPDIRYSKRLFDLVASLVGSLLISPLILLVALLVYFYHGSPVLFRQTRPGLKGRPFINYKFRTMLNIHDKEGRPISDAKRLTGLGRFLRSTSLDELPELFNVLRGEMSLVGPRPLLMQYLDRYAPEQARRHEVLPGITGWAQINGRNAISWEDKFRLDVWYVDHWTFWLDIKILLLTLWKVIRREGISQPGFSTAEEFFGAGEPQGSRQATAHESHGTMEKD
ncbi:MAG TPA: sugar transferase [Anaerolineales bacterium]|nr:sugar transferase [Anaerolineales bacterium]